MPYFAGERIRLFLLLQLLLIIGGRLAWGDPVYVSKSAEGRVTYSSRPPSSSSKAAHQLPEIMKEGTRANRVSSDSSAPCSGHGGLDCGAGPDVDGSVRCSDGFTGAPQIFRYSCPHPRLEVLEVIQQDGAPSAILVVRNSREINAMNPSVRIRSQMGESIPLKGPEVLEGGGLAIYELLVPKGVLPGGSFKVLKNHLWITCGNCG